MTFRSSWATTSSAPSGHGRTAKHLKIWFDAEGDYLEVIFDQKLGYFRETENDQVMKKVDEGGNVLGFSVLRVSAMQKKPEM